MKIAIVFGTRPEIIKLTPVIRYLTKKRIPFISIHSDQHYTYTMDKIFFEDLNLPQPTYQLSLSRTNALSASGQIASMMEQIDKVLTKEKPDWVLTQGDTNTVLAASLVTNRLSLMFSTSKKKFFLGHVEAGLRSYDRRMPEEFNRIVSDSLSDKLFVPSDHSRRVLLKEGYPKSRIHLTGNTIVDAVHQNLEIARSKSTILSKLQLKPQSYALLTLHRPENVDNPKHLRQTLQAVSQACHYHQLNIIFPIHPRTRGTLERYKISLPTSMQICEPLGYLDFLFLESQSTICLTDSGGVQEEAMILRVPCVTLRNNTERPETVQCGANKVTGTTRICIQAGIHSMLKKKRHWKNALGDGQAAKKIIDAILQAQ